MLDSIDTYTAITEVAKNYNISVNFLTIKKQSHCHFIENISMTAKNKIFLSEYHVASCVFQLFSVSKSTLIHHLRSIY